MNIPRKISIRLNLGRKPSRDQFLAPSISQPSEARKLSGSQGIKIGNDSDIDLATSKDEENENNNNNDENDNSNSNDNIKDDRNSSDIDSIDKYSLNGSLTGDNNKSVPDGLNGIADTKDKNDNDNNDDHDTNSNINNAENQDNTSNNIYATPQILIKETSTENVRKNNNGNTSSNNDNNGFVHEHDHSDLRKNSVGSNHSGSSGRSDPVSSLKKQLSSFSVISAESSLWDESYDQMHPEGEDQGGDSVVANGVEIGEPPSTGAPGNLTSGSGRLPERTFSLTSMFSRKNSKGAKNFGARGASSFRGVKTHHSPLKKSLTDDQPVDGSILEEQEPHEENEFYLYQHRQEDSPTIRRVGRRLESVIFRNVMDSKETHQLLTIFKAKKILAGTKIMTNGEESDAIYMVGSGRLKCTLGGKLVCFKTQGEFVNNELFNQALSGKAYKNCFDVEAEETTELVSCLLMDLLRFCAKPKHMSITPCLPLFARSTLLSSLVSFVAPRKDFLDVTETNRYLELFKYIFLKKDHALFHNGEIKHQCFVVVSGAVMEYTDYGMAHQKLVMQYGPGQVVGQYSLFLNIPQTNTVVAGSDTILFSLDDPSLQNYLLITPKLADVWKSSFEAVVKSDVIKQLKRISVPFINDFTDTDYEKLSQIATIKSYLTTDYIFIDGEESPRYFYVIAKGSCSIEVDGKLVGKISENSNFGEMSLISDKPRASTVIAAQPTILLCVDKNKFAECFMRIPSVVSHIKASLDPQAMSVHDIINHNEAFQAFQEHLQKECSEENIKFLHEVSIFNNLIKEKEGKDKQLEMAKEIFDKFIKRNQGFGGYNINVPQGMINSIEDVVCKGEGEITANLFDECVEAVLNLLSTDSLLRFKTSEAFKKFVAKMKEQRAAQ